MEEYAILDNFSSCYDEQVKHLRHQFDNIKDKRASNTVHSLSDVLMGGFAMFILKYPSLYRFEQRTRQEESNLKSLFGLSTVCTDAQMRNILDEISVDELRVFFTDYYRQLQTSGITEAYRYFDNCLIVALDGVEHFRSNTIHCQNCLCKEHKNGQIDYYHSMLVASIVCPQRAEVFPLSFEPIVRQDGAIKNDCERNACGRLMTQFIRDYEQERFIFTGDALFTNAPNIRRILANPTKSWHFILNIKPDSHKTLFKAFESRRKNKALKFMERRINGEVHRYHWADNLPLCETACDIRVNMLWYEITDKKGKTTRFTWITDFTIDKKNVLIMAQIGRCRWKIENETFNTLKNQGYHFEHNYGHGYKNLSSVLATLMLMAFAVDQLIQKKCLLFQINWKAAKSKKRLWETLRAIFITQFVQSFNHLYCVMANLFEVKLE